MKQQRHDVHECDVIGDLHGCFDELVDLVEKLGYEQDQNGLYSHPEGRVLVFVGDMTDRGPKNLDCLCFVHDHVQEGLALIVQGNHDNKLARWFKGNPVSVGHGLGMTVEEVEDQVAPSQYEYWSKWILGLPLVLELDNGKLTVSHAAPEPEDASKGKTKAVCLYGHTTGKKTSQGFPERMDWVPAYENSDREAFAVYGHVTHREPRLTDQTCCVDTACFAGNKLTALRWPSKELVSVESQQELTDRTSFFDDHPERTPKMKSYAKSKPITTMNRIELGKHLKDNEQEVLSLIDQDDLLMKRENEDGLIIANASKALFAPEKQHHLYAKGIVYKRDPYELVSLPLVKMFNLNIGENDVSDELAAELNVREDVDITFAEKLDGTMIQVFRHDGKVYFSTRGVLEGCDVHFEDQGFDFIQEARAIMEEQHPFFMQQLRGLVTQERYTYVFELIHPENKIVTDYGDEKKMVLLSMYDKNRGDYESYETLKEDADYYGLEMADVLKSDGSSLEEGLEEVKAELNKQDNAPEGSIVCFIKDDVIVHRVKAKLADYLELFRLKFHCTFDRTVETVLQDPALLEWEAFLDYLRENEMVEEEIEDAYKEHHDEFLAKLEEARLLKRRVELEAKQFRARTDEEPGTGEFFKQAALFHREHNPDLFGFLMNNHRGKNQDDAFLREVVDTKAIGRLKQEQDLEIDLL